MVSGPSIVALVRKSEAYLIAEPGHSITSWDKASTTIKLKSIRFKKQQQEQQK